MKNLHVSILFLGSLALVAGCNDTSGGAPPAPKPKTAPEPKDTHVPPVLVADPELDKKTVIKKSLIPGAGMGAFTAVPLASDETIGEFGGRLLRQKDRKGDDEYAVKIPKCAKKAAAPHVVIDGRDSRCHVIRINFAPYEINGKKTNLQNARIHGLCKKPYIVFKARRAIKAGEELYTSYGAHYGYYRFMYIKAVQDHFCKVAKIDCSKGFEFRPCRGCPIYRKKPARTR